MQTIIPRKWKDFQHYKQRRPPWIKLHRSWLDDYDFHCLPVASKALAPMLWLLASESMDGTIELNYSEIAFRLRQPASEIRDALTPLINKGFFLLLEDGKQVASDQLAIGYRDALPETETETETETEERQRQSADEENRKQPNPEESKPDHSSLVSKIGHLYPGKRNSVVRPAHMPTASTTRRRSSKIRI